MMFHALLVNTKRIGTVFQVCEGGKCNFRKKCVENFKVVVAKQHLFHCGTVQFFPQVTVGELLSLCE